MKIEQAPVVSLRRRKAPLRVVVSVFVFALSLLRPGFAADAPVVQCSPDWKDVTWETRYDQAKLARVRLYPKSLLPNQLAVVKRQQVTFTPESGAAVSLKGGWENGGYVFDSWDELVKLLEQRIGGISIKQAAFTQNDNHQIFALPPDQQKALFSQKGALALKVTCEMYKLDLRAKFLLDAPAPVQSGSILYQILPGAARPPAGAAPPTADATDKSPVGEVTYLNGKRVTRAEALATLPGNKERIDVSRKGTIDPADQRASRELVYVLVNPVDHSAMLLQGIGPNGFFDPGRDRIRIDVVDHLGVPPDKTPLSHKVLYVFDPLVGESSEVALTTSDFMMRWP